MKKTYANRLEAGEVERMVRAERAWRRRESRHARSERAQHRTNEKRVFERLERQVREIARCRKLTDTQAARLLALKTVVYKKMRRLLTANSRHLLLRMAQEPWVRPLETWHNRNKCPKRRLGSLIAHLLLPYDAPPSLLHEVADWTAQESARAARGVPIRERLALVLAIGRGASLRTLQADGRLPGCLTRRMLHHLCRVERRSLSQAIRVIQVAAFGGAPALADQINATFLGEAVQADPAFSQRVVHWLCRQPRVDDKTLLLLLAFLHHKRIVDPGYAMRGRTLASVRRRALAWQAHLERVRQSGSGGFLPSGFAAGDFAIAGAQWTFTEVDSPAALAAESEAMSHCVDRYGKNVASGQISVWSACRDGQRLFTVAVDNSARRIWQVRRRFNVKLTGADWRVVARWADHAGIQLPA